MTDATKSEASGAAARPRSLADLVTPSQAPAPRESFPPATLVKMGVLGAMVAAMNAPQFAYLLRVWWDDRNWSHGFIIPLFSLWLLYSRRDELFSARRRAVWWGLPMVLLACLMQIGAYTVQNPWLCQISMVLLMFSLVFYLAGPEVGRVTWLPILYLVFAMPISDSLYSSISLPLQNLGARGAGILLRLVGVKLEVAASNIRLQSIHGVWHELTVAEACSGMRLLMAFLALSVAIAYLEDRALWQRVILVAMGIPVAIVCNVLRVAITAAMFVVDKPELGRDFMHEFMGMLMLIPAFALLWLLGMLLNAVYVEDERAEDDDETQSAEASA